MHAASLERRLEAVPRDEEGYLLDAGDWTRGPG